MIFHVKLIKTTIRTSWNIWKVMLCEHGCAFMWILLIKSVMKERKRGKENIPLLLWYLNMGENFVVVNVQLKAFLVILHRCPLSPVPCPLRKNVVVQHLPRSGDRVQGHPMRRFTSTVPARGARAPNRAISNSCLWY